MTEPNLAPDPEPRKRPTVFLRRDEVMRRLGGISRDTLIRIMDEDPAFPRPAYWRGQTIWDEALIEDYARRALDNDETPEFHGAKNLRHRRNRAA